MAFVLKFLMSLVVFAAIAIMIARVLFPIAPVEGRVDTTALPALAGGRFAAAIARQDTGQTGVAMLRNGADAFAARILLADTAVSSIDAQYYIWHNDLTGYLLLDALRRAAERGVRVRLLVDDNGTSGLDAELAQLNAMPNAEVRIYNPFNLRRLKILSYGFDFFRLNRRMHNKSFTVDGLATVMGGRNIGDQYFDTGPTALYIDLDALAVGKIVPEVSADFDLYWAAKAVYPAGPIVGPPRPGDPISTGMARFDNDPQLADYAAILQGSDIVTSLVRGELALEWTNVLLISDTPLKGLGAVPREDLLAIRLARAVGEIKYSFDGISPYFVPGQAGVYAFTELEKMGIKVRMLTNALEATDVLPVHAGYAKRREDMLRAGVELFELRRQSEPAGGKEKAGPFGSSGASLHAKTFVVDGAKIFVGSFNFDPRSTTLNTEMGLLIDSKALAQGMSDAFDRGLDGLAWRVDLKDGKLVWRDPATGVEIHKEPGSTILKRLALRVIGWLPVEWLL